MDKKLDKKIDELMKRQKDLLEESSLVLKSGRTQDFLSIVDSFLLVGEQILEVEKKKICEKKLPRSTFSLDKGAKNGK